MFKGEKERIAMIVIQLDRKGVIVGVGVFI